MTEERGSFRPLLDSFGTLLSNPVVLEGLIAGLSAFSASRRAKEGQDSAPRAGGTASGLLDLLPGILPLLSTLTASAPAQPDGGGDAEAALEPAGTGGEDDTAFEPASADGEEVPLLGDVPASSSGVFVSDGDRASQRENLLLAIRPFLSDSRRSAADAMVQVNKLSGLFYGAGR